MHGTGICHYVRFVLAQTGSVANQVAMVDGVVVFRGMIAGSSQDCTGSGGIQKPEKGHSTYTTVFYGLIAGSSQDCTGSGGI